MCLGNIGIIANVALSLCLASTSDDSENPNTNESERFYPELNSFISLESTLDGSLVESNEFQHDDAELSANAFALLDFQLTQALSFELEASYNTAGDGEFFALGTQEFFIETLKAKYRGEYWGVEYGKLDMIYDIWDKSSGLFGSFQGDDLTLSEVIGVRVWHEFSDSYDEIHTVHTGLFQVDTTLLSSSLIADEVNRIERENGGLANTGKYNNWFVSINGVAPFDDASWEYTLGVVYQSPGDTGDEDDEKENRELSFLSSVSDEITLANEVEVKRFLEILYRDGADGFDRDALTIALGMSLDVDLWSYSASYSSRITEDNENSNSRNVDHNLDFYAGYVFNSGIYLDLGYQYLNELSGDEHLATIAIGIPFDFTIGGGPDISDAERESGLERIRQIKRN
jgi:hypothetical protein